MWLTRWCCSAAGIGERGTCSRRPLRDRGHRRARCASRSRGRTRSSSARPCTTSRRRGRPDRRTCCRACRSCLAVAFEVGREPVEAAADRLGDRVRGVVGRHHHHRRHHLVERPRLPTGSPMRIVSTRRVRVRGDRDRRPGHRRSTAVSAVMILAVLAGGTASCTLSPIRTAPVPASTTMSALGGGSAGGRRAGGRRA